SVPMAVFSVPVVLSNNAAAPTAVLESPLLRSSDPPPTAVLKEPVVRLNCENHPSAVLNPPLLRLKRALNPAPLLPPPRSSSSACACGESAKQANTGRMAINILLRFFILISFRCPFLSLAVREILPDAGKPAPAESASPESMSGYFLKGRRF